MSICIYICIHNTHTCIYINLWNLRTKYLTLKLSDWKCPPAHPLLLVQQLFFQQNIFFFCLFLAAIVQCSSAHLSPLQNTPIQFTFLFCKWNYFYFFYFLCLASLAAKMSTCITIVLAEHFHSLFFSPAFLFCLKSRPRSCQNFSFNYKIFSLWLRI